MTRLLGVFSRNIVGNAPAISRGWGRTVNHNHVQHIALQCATRFFKAKIYSHSFAEDITFIHQKSWSNRLKNL